MRNCSEQRGRSKKFLRASGKSAPSLFSRKNAKFAELVILTLELSNIDFKADFKLVDALSAGFTMFIH